MPSSQGWGRGEGGRDAPGDYFAQDRLARFSLIGVPVIIAAGCTALAIRLFLEVFPGCREMLTPELDALLAGGTAYLSALELWPGES
jgi:hypothetical protein